MRWSLDSRDNDDDSAAAATAADVDSDFDDVLRIAVDEVGRGTLFGRVYASAVVVAAPHQFALAALNAGVDIKDSKKFSSAAKRGRSATFIKTHVKYWAVAFEEASVVDDINIRQATFSAVHKCIANILLQAAESADAYKQVKVYMDGNDFIPCTHWDRERKAIVPVQYRTIIKGDAQYGPIACASILAKEERDDYIRQLCADDAELDSKYALCDNKGYGTKRHMDGLRKHGLSPHHRRTFIHL